jgi:hypothetical protein
LAAGGADEKEKKGKTLTVQGESTFKVLSGHGASQRQFLGEVAKHLPVRIEGFDNGAQPHEAGYQNQTTISMLDGRFKDILEARRSASSERDSLRKPFTCDLVTELVLVFLVILIGWYCIAVISTFIGWAFRRGAGQCMHPMKPGDMCATWRIFVPMDVPIMYPSDYLNVLFLVCGFLALPLGYLVYFVPMEYRFHKNGIMQEVLFGGWEFQDNTMVFPSDVETVELVDSSFEGKYVKVAVKACYVIQAGISKPFKIKACFVPKELKLNLVDVSCASCTGQGAQATDYRERMFQLINKFKPGSNLPGSDASTEA